jgi:iron(III) transport system substrate-binding protein
MKRTLSLILASLMVVSLSACAGGGTSASTASSASATETASTAASAEATSEASATEDIGTDLVLYATMTDNDINSLKEGFKQKYPNVNIEVVNGSAGELEARIVAEKDNPQGDVMWGGLGNSDGDMYSDVFEHYTTQYESDVGEYKSNNGFYNLDHLSTVAFCVNTDLEKQLGLNIQGYADLLDPKLKGKIVFSDPNSSSAAWNNICNLMSVYGKDSQESWDYITKLLKNGLVISTSSSVCFKSVQQGEYVVGMSYEDGISTLLKSGATNIRLQYPVEGTSASAFGCAVIKGAPHMAAAKALVNYLMSPEGQTFLGNQQGTIRYTNSKATYKSPYLPDSSSIKWVTRDVDWFITNKKAVLQKWNQIRSSVGS